MLAGAAWAALLCALTALRKACGLLRNDPRSWFLVSASLSTVLWMGKDRCGPRGLIVGLFLVKRFHLERCDTTVVTKDSSAVVVDTIRSANWLWIMDKSLTISSLTNLQSIGQ